MEKENRLNLFAKFRNYANFDPNLVGEIHKYYTSERDMFNQLYNTLEFHPFAFELDIQNGIEFKYYAWNVRTVRNPNRVDYSSYFSRYPKSTKTIQELYFIFGNTFQEEFNRLYDFSFDEKEELRQRGDLDIELDVYEEWLTINYVPVRFLPASRSTYYTELYSNHASNPYLLLDENGFKQILFMNNGELCYGYFIWKTQQQQDRDEWELEFYLQLEPEFEMVRPLLEDMFR